MRFDIASQLLDHDVAAEAEKDTEMKFLNPKGDDSEVAKAFEAIQEFWFPHVRQHVEARYELGKRINSFIGKPSWLHQQVEPEVIERLAWNLGLDVLALQRIRNFARVYETFQEFASEEDCPGCWLVNWSRESGMRPPLQIDEDTRI